MEPSPNRAAFSIPLLGAGELCQTHLDPQSWAETVSAVIPVRNCEPLLPPVIREPVGQPAPGSPVMLATQGSSITLANRPHRSREESLEE